MGNIYGIRSNVKNFYMLSTQCTFVNRLKTKISCLSKNSSLNIFITETECVYCPVGPESLVVPGLIVEVSQRPYLTTHNTQRRQTFMPPAEFKPAIPTNEQPRTHVESLTTRRVNFRL
jgi:hypothetical protein